MSNEKVENNKELSSDKESPTIDECRKCVRSLSDDVWSYFFEFVNKEHNRRQDQLKEKAKKDAIEAVEKYGFNIEDVFEEKSQEVDPTKKTSSKKGGFPNSAIIQIKKLSPAGLFNPDAPKEEQNYCKPKDSDRWARIDTVPWLKEELENLYKEKSRASKADLEAIVAKYPPQAQ